ncbi:hypothetical protein [Pseudodesulfovibrio sp.]|uniref:hypothetical protein n=1 Tax=unclassified Pseudodesulfovibrio TaxID=2661612 RepID=UPI003B0015C0
MRVNAYASEQYRRTQSLAKSTGVAARTKPQASVTTTSFGFRLGNFGLDFESERTVLDPSLSRTEREQKYQANAFRAEQQVSSLRAQVGSSGASYRNLSGSTDSGSPASAHRVRSALSAYAASAMEESPLPGSMLASVV